MTDKSGPPPWVPAGGAGDNPTPPPAPPPWPGYPPQQYPPQSYPPTWPGYPPPPYGAYPYQPPQPFGYFPPRGPAPGLAYASFGYRLLAWLIDFVILIGFLVAWVALVGAVSPTNSSVTGGIIALLVITILGGILAFNVFIVGRLGGTLGMRAVSLRIVREADGSQIGYALAAGRFGMYTLFCLFSFIGLLIDTIVIAFDPRRQAIHDKACSTLVVRPIR